VDEWCGRGEEWERGGWFLKGRGWEAMGFVDGDASGRLHWSDTDEAVTG